MGQVYYDMGLLASTDVEETSATDLVGQYVGQTGPKTKALLEKALGKVLFIDEAYRLAEGPFGKEAVDELVDSITKPMFSKKLIIILAGYDNEINDLMSTNSGITSRFPELVQFNSLSPDYCIQLLITLLAKRRKQIAANGDFELDLTSLEKPTESFSAIMRQTFEILSQTSNWANARDVQTLAKSIFKKVLQTADGNSMTLTRDQVLDSLTSMLQDRSAREIRVVTDQRRAENNVKLPPLLEQSPSPQRASTFQSATFQAQELEQEDIQQSLSPIQDTEAEVRDPGVSDETWVQLQQDKATALAFEQSYVELEATCEKQQEALNEISEQATKQPPTDLEDDAKMHHEKARLERLAKLDEQRKILEGLEREKKDRGKKRQEEEQAQKKLRDIGFCPVGYRWIKQVGGYRCAAGSHFVSDEMLATH